MGTPPPPSLDWYYPLDHLLSGRAAYRRETQPARPFRAARARRGRHGSDDPWEMAQDYEFFVESGRGFSRKGGNFSAKARRDGLRQASGTFSVS
jgi:hypothetical protein